MKTVGVVAEYNPFHQGHLYHIETVRAMLGEEVPVVAVMSGDFVQRGEAAVFSKFARAEAAVRCGVSLVLELPAPWCLSSAEGFARGGIGLLSAAGVVDTVSFGSECGDPERLRRCADAIDSQAFSAVLREKLAGGTSFAAAREGAVRELLGKDADVLRGPNDLLGVEYIRAADRMDKSISFLPVRRVDSVHDGPGSAAELRSVMGSGDGWLERIPAPAAEVFRREISEGRGPVTEEKLRLPLLSRLRMLSEEDYADLPDASEGLDHRL